VKDSCEFPTEEMVGAQNVTFTIKCPKMGDISPKFLLFLKENYL